MSKETRCGRCLAAIERRLCDARSWWFDMVRLYAATCGILGCIASASAADTPQVEQVRVFSELGGSAAIEFLRSEDVAPDPGMTLNSVEIALSLTISGGGVMVDNDGPQGGLINAFFQASLFLISDDVVIPSAFTSIVNSAQLEVGPDDEHVSGTPVFDFDSGPDISILLPLEFAHASSEVGLAPVLVDQFRGTGSFDVSAELFTQFSISGLPTVAGSFSGINVENAAVSLRYTYAPAAPTSALLASALFCCRRRRRA